jgi:hypothetical protein
VADALLDAFTADATAIAAQIGRPALDELLAAHRLWSDWLRDGRVRKLAIVASSEVASGGGRTRGLEHLDRDLRRLLQQRRELDGPDHEHAHPRTST